MMATDSIRVSAKFPVKPERLYRAWLDSVEHGRFTGGTASIEPVVGGRFMAWDDYMTGMILQLESGRRVVQTWRTTEFPDAAPDARLEVLFEPEGDGTRLTLIHSDIPGGDGDKYEDGWIDYYFEPMQRYFKRVAAEENLPHVMAIRAARGKPKSKGTLKVKVAATKKAANKAAKKPAKMKPTRKKAAKKPARKAKAAKMRAARKPARKPAARRKPARKTVRRAAKKRVARKATRKRVVRKAARRGAKKK